MKKQIIASLILLLATEAAAQTQPPSPIPQKAAPRPPAPSPATPATEAFYCLFDGKEYSIGAAMCISSQLSQFCKASDSEHARPWWFSGQEARCAATSPARAAVEGSTGAPPPAFSSAPKGAP
jgi:hypothetical protein